ncbi:MAG: Yip1 family protein [Novosphingobium sp.]
MDPNLENAAKGIFERAKSIILTPKDEWPKIEAETKTQGEILMGYVLPLVALGPIASLIGSQVFGYGAFGYSYRPPLVASLVTAVVSFGVGVAMVFILAFIADWLAPKFDGQANKANAFKLVAYGGTAAWAVGIFSLVPMLGVFGILGLYSLYLYYTGAAPMMKVPQEKSVGYVAVIIVCAFFAAILVTPITAAITGAVGYGAMSGMGRIGSNDTGGGTLTLPGGTKIDTGKIEKMSKQAENSFNGKTPPVDAAKMQALMPPAIGSYQRTAQETVGAAVGGSQAEGTYTSGDNNFKLRITDMTGFGALAGVAGALGVSQSREDADGYERTGTVNGHMQTEKWNKSSNRGKFGVVVADRFMVEAEGKAASIDELKAAVATINPDDLSDLAG